MAHFRGEIDTAKRPVVFIRWVGTPDDTAALDAFLADLLRVFKEAEAGNYRITLVVDASEAAAMSANLRQHQANWLATHRRLTNAVLISVHVCITNPLVRGALTAIRWISSDLEMVRVHGRVDGALAGALADLETVRQPVTLSRESDSAGPRDAGS